MVDRPGNHSALTMEDSTPSFEPRPTAPAGAPNVVVIVLDDVGFAQLGCFGSDIDTPGFDRLAAGGLRYNRFHVTALCSPTRASLLTGRNHHAVGMGFLPDMPLGYPGYTGRIPPSAATMPQVLRDAGYSTFAVGKWHLTPRWEISASGPFDHWPLGVGFERYYGFLNGDTNQWTPDLVCDNGFVDAPAGPEEGYHLTEDLADRAMRFVQDQQQATPGRPFLLWLATGAGHAPHQVAPEWIERYRGNFDDGWEAWRERVFARQVEAGVVPEGTTLLPRPPWVQDWAALSSDERRLFARMMEVYAGFLSHTDAQIARLIDHLDTLGVLDNTVIMALSDNGASAEGGPIGSFNEHRFTHDQLDDFADTLARIDDLGGFRAYNHYPWGWAWAGNTPLRLWKRYTWLGGVRTPLIVHWPAGIRAAGEIRNQVCHAVDLWPTVLDAAGLAAPAAVDGVDQQPMHGASLVPTFADPDAAAPRATQYFEIAGSRAIYHEGWKATTDHIGNQLSVEKEQVPGSHDFDTDHWALFRLDDDFAEAHDVADQHPDVVRDLEDRWWAEAEANQVLPITDSLIGRAMAMEPSPNAPRHRTVYRPGGGPIAEDMLPSLGGGCSVIATVEVPAGGADGIVCALGDWNNGWALYVLDGRVCAGFTLFSRQWVLRAPERLAPGVHEIRLTHDRRAVTIAVDGAAVADGSVEENLPFRWQIGGGGLLIGHDKGFPVNDDYDPPFPFGGRIDTVVFEVPTLAPTQPIDEQLAQALHHE